MSLQKRFKARYPKANFADFKTGDFFGKPNIFFHNKAGEGTTVFDDDGKDFRSSIYFSKEMKRQLGLAPGFPLELTHNPNPKLEIPAVPFNSETRDSRRSSIHTKRRSCSTRNICHPERKIQNKVSRYFY